MVGGWGAASGCFWHGGRQFGNGRTVRKWVADSEVQMDRAGIGNNPG